MADRSQGVTYAIAVRAHQLVPLGNVVKEPLSLDDVRNRVSELEALAQEFANAAASVMKFRVPHHPVVWRGPLDQGRGMLRCHERHARALFRLVPPDPDLLPPDPDDEHEPGFYNIL